MLCIFQNSASLVQNRDRTETEATRQVGSPLGSNSLSGMFNLVQLQEILKRQNSSQLHNDPTEYTRDLGEAHPSICIYRGTGVKSEHMGNRVASQNKPEWQPECHDFNIILDG